MLNFVYFKEEIITNELISDKKVVDVVFQIQFLV